MTVQPERKAVFVSRETGTAFGYAIWCSQKGKMQAPPESFLSRKCAAQCWPFSSIGVQTKSGMQLYLFNEIRRFLRRISHSYGDSSGDFCDKQMIYSSHGSYNVSRETIHSSSAWLMDCFTWNHSTGGWRNAACV